MACNFAEQKKNDVNDERQNWYELLASFVPYIGLCGLLNACILFFRQVQFIMYSK